MLGFRVFGFDPRARPGTSGHPDYLHRPQGQGRWDNPVSYDTWYLATSAAGAIAEAFGNLSVFSEQMFDTPYLAGGRRALAVFSLPDDLRILDLDDAANLLALTMRPSQVVIRNLAYTQVRAQEIFDARDTAGARDWAGVGWWSFHRPVWHNLAIFVEPGTAAPLTLLRVDELSLDSPWVAEAQRELARDVRR